jgi:putative transposase
MLSISRGDKVCLNGNVLVFTHRTSEDEFCFRDPGNGAVKQLNQTEVLQKFADGNLELRVPVNDNTNPQVDPDALDYSCASELHQKIAEERRSYVRAIFNAGNPSPMAKTWPEIIANVALSLGHTQPPRWTTVRRWMHKFQRNQADIRSLLPNFAHRGRAPATRKPEEEEFLNEIVRDYLVESRPSIRWLMDQIEARYRQAKLTRPSAATWQPPSRSSVKRRIRRMDPYQVACLRYGKRIADERFRAIGPGRPATYRLEVVEIDHTTATIELIDEKTRQRIGRPTITVAIDRYTRMIMGLYIGFEPPSTYSVMQCLRDMLLPKTYLQTEIPDLKLSWNAFGPPITVVVDNAMEFVSDSFRHVAAVVGFDIYQQPVYQPQFKGTVERFMRTIEQGLMSGMPGRTFSNPTEKGKYDSIKTASITLKEFRRLFYHWMLAEYCNRTHSGTSQVPARMWEEEVKRDPIQLPYNARDLDSLLGMSRTGVITRQGLRHAGLFYQSEELNAIFRNARTKADRTVEFKVNPGDLGSISVYGEKLRHPIRVFCTQPDYANGTTLHQHRQHRALQLKHSREFESDVSIIEARDAFRKLTAELLKRSKTPNRKRHTRGLGDDLVEQRLSESDLDYVEKMVTKPEEVPDLQDLLEEDTFGEIGAKTPSSADEPAKADSIGSETTQPWPSRTVVQDTAKCDSDDVEALPIGFDATDDTNNDINAKS